MTKIWKDIRNNGPANLGIINKLTIFVNVILPEYIEIIKKYPQLIDSDKTFKILEEEIKKNGYQKNSYAFNIIAAVAGIGFLITAGPATATTAVAAEGIATLLGFTCVTSRVLSRVEDFKVLIKKWSINNLKKNLSIEVDELIENIKLFSINLISIVTEIGKIETFWESQIERIKELIKYLETFKEVEKRHKRDHIVYSIEKEWKDVERECQIYSHVMKDLLNKEKLSSE
jgi:hypothetical protein